VFDLRFNHIFSMVVSLSIVDEVVVDVGSHSCVGVLVSDIVVVRRVEFISSINLLVVANTQLIGFVGGLCFITSMILVSSIVRVVNVNSMIFFMFIMF
jgi:hypothetical protein